MDRHQPTKATDAPDPVAMTTSNRAPLGPNLDPDVADLQRDFQNWADYVLIQLRLMIEAYEGDVAPRDMTRLVGLGLRMATLKGRVGTCTTIGRYQRLQVLARRLRVLVNGEPARLETAKARRAEDPPARRRLLDSDGATIAVDLAALAAGLWDATEARARRLLPGEPPSAAHTLATLLWTSVQEAEGSDRTDLARTTGAIIAAVMTDEGRPMDTIGAAGALASALGSGPLDWRQFAVRALAGLELQASPPAPPVPGPTLAPVA